jgi:hypothetical protein
MSCITDQFNFRFYLSLFAYYVSGIILDKDDKVHNR